MVDGLLNLGQRDTGDRVVNIGIFVREIEGVPGWGLKVVVGGRGKLAGGPSLDELIRVEARTAHCTRLTCSHSLGLWLILERMFQCDRTSSTAIFMARVMGDSWQGH